MAKYFDMLLEDVRLREGLTACMNCGVCTAVCPAAAFYNYDPRQIVSIVQTRDDEAIEELLKSEEIWYCGECMSCRPRCPRGNTPGYVIQALRTLSQKLGFFVERISTGESASTIIYITLHNATRLLCTPGAPQAIVQGLWDQDLHHYVQ